MSKCTFGSVMPGRQFTSESYRYGFNGQEKDDEVYGNSNAYDFGARMYDARLGKWFAIDPFFKDYAPVSPYNYALGNPIVLLDAGGRKVIGSDGKEVTYTREKDGTITWSANATEDIKKIGGAMLQAPEGELAFNTLQAVKQDIHFVYNTTDKGSNYGMTVSDRNSSTITLYEQVIDDPKANQGAEGSTPALDKTETIGSVGTHEAWHAIMAHVMTRKQIKELRKTLGVSRREFKSGSKLDGFLPRLSERQFRKEYREKKLGGKKDNTKWEEFYDKNGWSIQRLMDAIVKKQEKADEKKKDSK